MSNAMHLFSLARGRTHMFPQLKKFWNKAYEKLWSGENVILLLQAKTAYVRKLKSLELPLVLKLIIDPGCPWNTWDEEIPREQQPLSGIIPAAQPAVAFILPPHLLMLFVVCCYLETQLKPLTAWPLREVIMELSCLDDPVAGGVTTVFS